MSESQSMKHKPNTKRETYLKAKTRKLSVLSKTEKIGWQSLRWQCGKDTWLNST